MNFRFGVFVLLGLAMSIVGCGSGAAPAGGGPGGTPAPQDLDDELPAWVEELPAGQEPESNTFTGRAQLALVQAYEAEEAEDEEAAMERYREALEIVEEGLAESPQNAELLRQGGEAMLALGQYEEGAAMLDQAEEIYPRILYETMVPREIAWAELLNQGFEQQDAGDLQGAIERFELAHTVYKQRPEAMLNLASAYSQLDRVDEAIDMFGQAIEVVEGPWGERIDEETQQTWTEQLDVARSNRAQLLLMEERYDEASDAFEGLVEDSPDDLQLLASYGAALVGANRMEDAEVIFDDLLNRPGLDAADFYSIAVGLYQAENFEQAAAAFREAYDRVPEHRDVVYNLAQTLYVSDQWEDLLPVAEELIAVDPLNQNAYTFMAQALIRLERDDEGLALLEERDALPYVMQGLGLQIAGEEIVVAGQLLNRSAPAGTPVTLRVYFYDVDGVEMGSEEVTVELGPEEEAVAFQVAAPDDDSLFGFRYEEL